MRFRMLSREHESNNSSGVFIYPALLAQYTTSIVLFKKQKLGYCGL